MEPLNWLVAVGGLVGGLFGGGGIATYVQARTDRRKSVGEMEVSKNDAISAQWQAIVKTQTESLVAPLRESIREMEEEMDGLKGELHDSRAKYWRAVTYIRKLQTYIIRHLPEGQAKPPEPPVEIVGDI